MSITHLYFGGAPTLSNGQKLECMGSEGNDTKKALIQAIEAQLDELAKNTALPESMKIDLLREILAGMNSEDQRGDTNEQS